MTRKRKKILAPRSPQQRAFLKAKSDALPGHLRPLELKLLSHGGSFALIPPNEQDYKEILEGGYAYPMTGRTIRWSPSSGNLLVEGIPNRCHENASRIFMERYPSTTRIVTGYALSDDGIWRQHSWLRWGNGWKRGVIETTEKRVLYFGVELADLEAVKFACSNVDTETAMRFLTEKLKVPVKTIMDTLGRDRIGSWVREKRDEG